MTCAHYRSVAALLCGVAAITISAAATAQQTAQAVTSMVQDAVRFQLEDMHHAGWSLRYQVHRVDSKEDSIRNVVESSDGNVARTLKHHGTWLSPEEDAAELDRLRSLSPGDMARHRRSSDSSDKYGLELITAMPAAMNFVLTPDQPQLPQFRSRQVVLDYTPNPAFRPASTVQSLLPGLAGRMWIDAETHHLLRIEVNVTKNLNLALGLLARVYQGGTMTYEQQPLPNGHDAYTHIEINVMLRELMVKTLPYHSTLNATNIVLLPAVPSLQEAVQLLLNPENVQRP
ncbi:MAG: hypothetical protein ACRYGF_01265 [Janthinobacterium lividum]